MFAHVFVRWILPGTKYGWLVGGSELPGRDRESHVPVCAIQAMTRLTPPIRPGAVPGEVSANATRNRDFQLEVSPAPGVRFQELPSLRVSGANRAANEASREAIEPNRLPHSPPNARAWRGAFVGRRAGEATRRPREGRAKSTL